MRRSMWFIAVSMSLVAVTAVTVVAASGPEPIGEGPLGAPIHAADVPCLNWRADEVGRAEPANDIYLDDREIFWPVAAPADVGMDAGLLKAGVAEAMRAPTLVSLLIARRGRLVLEAYAPGAAATHARNLHSATKGVVSLVAGAAIAHGLLPGLETPIGDILEEASGTPVGAVTLEELLSLSGGVFEGDERFLLRDAVEHPLVADPGAAWAYGNAGVELVAVALERTVPGGLCRYAHRVLAPLDITVDHWHRDLDGHVTGRAYAFLTARELARIGQLMLQRGRWGTDQIVPEAWVDAMVTPRFDVEGSPFDPKRACAGTQARTASGLLWRVGRVGGHETWSASGYGGQYLVVVPDLELVMVVQHDTFHDAVMELQRHVAPTAFLESFVLPGLADDPAARSLCATDLAVADMTGADPQALAPAPGDELLPEWSPDGSRIAFTSTRDLNAEIMVMDADGTDLQRLTTDWAVDVWPRWSPDGSRLLFLSDRDAVSMSGLPWLVPQVLDLATGVVTAVDVGPGRVFGATWTPDDRIAVTRSERLDGMGSLWVADLDGGPLTRVPGPEVGWPTWAPTGDLVAVVTGLRDDQDEPFTIGVLDARTGAITELGPAADLPTWSADGHLVTVLRAPAGPRLTFIDITTGHRTSGPVAPRGRPSPDGMRVVWARSPAGP